MERHGFGRKTFELETDDSGHTAVHHVIGKFDNSHYGRGTLSKVDEEIPYTPNNVDLIWIDIDDDEGFSQIGGAGGGDSHSGRASVTATNFGTAPPLVYIDAWVAIVHELGHAFGLPHDYRSDRYMMSYGDFILKDQLSKSAAEWLDAHRYFNTEQTSIDHLLTVQMLSPSLESPPNSIRLNFSVRDPDGLHTARLITNSIDPGKEQADKVLDHTSLDGERDAEIEFVTTELAARSQNVALYVMDTFGNFIRTQFEIDVASLRATSETVTIPDPELESAIRENLNLPSGSITQLDILDLTTLAASNYRIKDLTGLEHATNLKYLDLNENQISDLSPLNELVRLRSILVIRNQITDLIPLSDLTELSELWAWDNQINDIAPLSKLTYLTNLQVGGNQVEDLSPLDGLTKIRILGLQYNRIRDITSLARLPLLGELFLMGNQIEDLTSLSGLGYLEELGLAGNPVSDTSPLRGPLRRYPDMEIDVEVTLLLLVKISGDEQEGSSGTTLANPLVVEVWDLYDNPLPDETVTFSIDAGGGTLSETTATTDIDGRASTTLTLGRDPGRNTVVARVAELKPVVFSATGLAIPTTLAKVSGDEKQGAAGSALADPFVVEVRDQNNDPLVGAEVTFAVTAGGGTLSATTATTDADGRAAATLTLRVPGANTVTASVEGLAPVTFTATAKVSTDFDGDGETDFSDFFLFADAFGSSDPRFDLDGSGSVDFADFFLLADHFSDPARGKLLAMAREMIGLPDGPQLQQNAPNPFNSQTVISWFLLRPGTARVEVFALTGQRVAVLHQGPKKAGVHRVHWNGRDDRGRPLASGVYLYRLVTNENVQTRKLTLLR